MCPLLNREITTNVAINHYTLNACLPPLVDDEDINATTALMDFANKRDYLDSIRIISEMSFRESQKNQSKTAPPLYKTTISTEKSNTNTTIDPSPPNDKVLETNIDEVTITKTITQRTLETYPLIYTSIIPRYPQYKDPIARYHSYATWTKDAISVDGLIMAGFYFTRNYDKVKCFHCGLGLKLWGPKDDPWRHHSRWSPKCFYLRLMKGIGYEQMIRHENEITDTINEISLRNEDETESDPKTVCKLCYLFPIETVILPCGHAAACKTCAKIIHFTTRKCPVCRDTYKLYHEITIVG